MSPQFYKTKERYSRGRRGCPAKALVRETVARVRIPLSPPKDCRLNFGRQFFKFRVVEN